MPPAVPSHLPDFIRDDLSLALTIDGSGGPLTTLEALEKAHSLLASLAGASFFRALVSCPGGQGGTPCRREQLGTGMGRAASGVFLLVCSWISGFMWGQLSLRLRGEGTCLGMSAGA